MRIRSLIRHVSRQAFVLLLAAAPCVLLQAETIEPGAKVYILRMKSGFDVHLANRLTESGLVVVVSKPADADYLFTDAVGEGFEDKLKELYPPPPEEEKPKAEGDDDEPKRKEPPVVNTYATRRTTSFGRAEGAIFLVSRDDASVRWSTFLERRDTRPTTMNKQAGTIVKRMKHWIVSDRKATEKQLKKEAEAAAAAAQTQP